MEIVPDRIRVFDTQTGKGDPEVLLSFKRLALKRALFVLHLDSRNFAARRVARWAVRSDLHDPDLTSLTAVSRQAGFDTEHYIFNPSTV